MTAASPARSPASSHSTQSSPACLPACRRHLRKSRELQNKLHLRSAPGAWLLLGAGVVLVGMGLAVAGYVSAAAPRPAGARGATHVERMKLAGPVVMGVGLFIFICAATLLYENRDREVLRQESLDDLEDLKGGSGWDDSREQPSFGCQEPWEGGDGEPGPWAGPARGPPAPGHSGGPPASPYLHRGDGRDLGAAPLPGDGEKADRKEEKKKEGGRSTLLARVLHHQEPAPRPPSPCPSVSRSVCSDSCNSSDIHFNLRTGSPLPAQH